jgi:hypothetical protein
MRWLFQTAESFAEKGALELIPGSLSDDFLLVDGEMIGEFVELAALIHKLQEFHESGGSQVDD